MNVKSGKNQENYNFTPVCQFPQHEGSYHNSSHEGRHCALKYCYNFYHTIIPVFAVQIVLVDSRRHLAFVVEVAYKTPFGDYA